MSTLTAATWVAAFVLVLAGARKVTQPDTTGSALRTARLPSDRRLVRVLGAGEVALGVTVLAVGGPVPVALLALAYGSFALIAERQRRAGSDCGCFGTTGTPVTALHVLVDAVLAAIGLGVAVLPGHAPALTTMAVRQPVATATAAVLVVAAANLLRLLLTAAPELAAAIALLEPDGAA